MCISKQRIVAIIFLSMLAWCVGLVGFASFAEDKKPAIPLPMDPKAVVLAFDPGAGGFFRKGPAPYLKISAAGEVTVTSLFDGTKKEAKLSAKELDDLLRFVVEEQGFLKVTAMEINDGIKEASAKGPFIAVGGAGTSVISVQPGGKKHEVSFRGASAYAQTYPKVVPLAQFAAVEKRLSELAAGVEKGK